MTKIDSINILGVRVDRVTEDQTVSLVDSWLRGSFGKHYIVTPNVEFVMLAQSDGEFGKVLNGADLAIPDSARFGWAQKMGEEKNFLKKILFFPFFLASPIFGFPVTTGSSLIYLLCKHFSQGVQKEVVTIGLLGGRAGVAVKASECLQKLYPGLKVVFADDGPEVDEKGMGIARGPATSVSHRPSSSLSFVRARRWEPSSVSPLTTTSIIVPPLDILFVGFGARKQEMWIAKNLPHLPVRVAVGVGGSFDYISGRVPRAPGWIRALGLEWLFRLLRQPWRIRRFGALIKFVFLTLFS